MARSERGFKEGGKSFGRKVRKRAPSIEKVIRSRRKGEGVGSGSGGREEGRRKGDGPVADGRRTREFSRGKTHPRLFPERGEFFVFLN